MNIQDYASEESAVETSLITDVPQQLSRHHQPIRNVSVAVDTLDLNYRCKFCCKTSKTVSTDTYDLNLNLFHHKDTKNVSVDTSDLREKHSQVIFPATDHLLSVSKQIEGTPECEERCKIQEKRNSDLDFDQILEGLTNRSVSSDVAMEKNEEKQINGGEEDDLSLQDKIKSFFESKHSRNITANSKEQQFFRVKDDHYIESEYKGNLKEREKVEHDDHAIEDNDKNSQEYGEDDYRLLELTSTAKLSRQFKELDEVSEMEESSSSEETQSQSSESSSEFSHQSNSFELICSVEEEKSPIKSHENTQGDSSSVENEFSCNQCHQKFSDENLLQEHLTAHSEISTFPCEKCYKLFQSSASLANHMKKHRSKSKNPKDCNGSESGKATTERKSSIKMVRNRECQVCNKAFRTTKALREHQVVHTGARDHLCNICGKAFGTAANMRMHRLTHSDKRPYSCLTCGATFRQKDSLKIHSRKHTGERPYACPVCNMTFDRSFTLKNHVLTHGKVKAYVCSSCGKAFTTRGGLNNHERIHYKDPSKKKDRKPRAKPGTGNYICDECGRIYSTPSNLRMHQRTHQSSQARFPCPVCSKDYKSRDSMEVHMRRHTENRPYSCHICSRSFYRNYTLKLHVLTHTGEKPHSCPVEGCDKSFVQSSSLSYHIRNHKKHEDRVSKQRKHKDAFLEQVVGNEISSKTDTSINNGSMNLDDRLVKEGKSMCLSKCGPVEASDDLDLSMNNLPSQNVLDNSGCDDINVPSMLDVANHLVHMPHQPPLIWDDNLAMMGIVNNVQTSQSHHLMIDHPSSLQLHQPHPPVHLMQLATTENLPLLVSVPDGVLFQHEVQVEEKGILHDDDHLGHTYNVTQSLSRPHTNIS